MKQYTVSIHLHKMLMHNAQTADPTNVFAKAMKEISGKRKKSEADHEQLALIEYEAGLYLNRNREVILPGRLFEALIAEGAKVSKEGKSALAATIVENDPTITYDGGPLTVEELKKSADHKLVVPVKVSTSKIMRTRPMFENVKATFIVALQTELANPAQLKRWVEDGLNQRGLGDWRPRYGRGAVTAFEEVKVPNPMLIAAE
jgi:hypothetical protein